MSTNFTLVKRGYNPVEVDSYIKTLEQQLSEYREKSAAINNAIINAQLAADNIIKEAHLKTDKMLAGAETDALSLKQNTLSQLTSIKTNVANQRKLMESFQNDYNELIKKYLAPVEANEVSPMLAKLNDIEKLINELSTVKPVEKSPEEKAVAKITADMPEPKAAEAPSPAPSSNLGNPYAKSSTPSSDLGNPYAKSSTPSSDLGNPYAKSSTPSSDLGNPYAKSSTPSSDLGNPYAKSNNAPVSNPYAKAETPAPTPAAASTNPYAKPNNAPVGNPYAKAETPTPAPAATPTNPYAKPNNASVNNPYAKPQNTPAQQNNNGAKPPLGGAFAKPMGGLNNNKPLSPFAKKPEENTPAAATTESTQANVNPFAKPQQNAPKPNNAPSEEMSVINEDADYSPFLSSHAMDDNLSQDNYGAKPGIYKATDLYSEYASSVDKSGISKEELDEFMPGKH